MTDEPGGNAEIERKFLVLNDSWQPPRKSIDMAQGYLLEDETKSLRIRREGDRYRLTIKAKTAEDARLERREFQYDIPDADGRHLLALCRPPLVKKTRHLVDHDGHCWEIDVFSGANDGLVVAEVELQATDERFSLPPWAGPEVTEDPRFTNANLYRAPFSGWGVSYADILAEFGADPAQYLKAEAT